MFHPCKKCIIQACCTNKCYKFQQYIDFSSVMVIILAGIVTFLVPLSLIYYCFSDRIVLLIELFILLWLIISWIFLMTYQKLSFTKALNIKLVHIFLSPVIFTTVIFAYFFKMRVWKFYDLRKELK